MTNDGRRSAPALIAGALAISVAVMAAMPLAISAQEPAERVEPADSARIPALRTSLQDLLGERVRIVTAPPLERDYRGLLDSVKAMSVVVDTVSERPQGIFGGAPPVLERYRRITIDMADIRSVQVSRGTSRMRGVLFAGLIGAAAVGTLEVLGGTPTRNPGGKDFVTAALRGAAIGFTIGAPVGYLLGRERWSEVSLGGG
jgi:hypothetical protein